MSQFLIAGVLSNDWQEGGMVVHPFTLGATATQPAQKRVTFRILPRKHLLETALDWEAKKAANPHIQTAEIAKEAGISPGRVRQIMRLLKLHADIRAAILKLRPKQAKKCFPERTLRKWTTLPLSIQLVHFGNQICRDRTKLRIALGEIHCKN